MGYSITELKKGTVFQMEGVPYVVVEYSQKVMGRGGSIVNVRIKNLLNAAVLQKTFKGNETLDTADVTSQNVQYLYNDGSTFYFMNQDSFEQFELSSDMIADNAGYLKEGDMVQVQLFDGRVINMVLPKNVYLKVTYAESAVKGDTSSSIQKDATTETGLIVKVPAFIKVGDVVSVDTESGAYRERKKDV
jgi:elongation factor P